MEIIKELLQKSDASGSKSTILKPLSWFISIIIIGLILAINNEAPNWIIILFAIILSILVIVFIGSYIYCLIYDKDAIRSEKFSIQKLAIEKGLIGDNLIGIIEEYSKIKNFEQIVKLGNSEEGEIK